MFLSIELFQIQRSLLISFLNCILDFSGFSGLAIFSSYLIFDISFLPASKFALMCPFGLALKVIREERERTGGQRGAIGLISNSFDIFFVVT
jgi:hypothetical protein